MSKAKDGAPFPDPNDAPRPAGGIRPTNPILRSVNRMMGALADLDTQAKREAAVRMLNELVAAERAAQPLESAQ